MVDSRLNRMLVVLMVCVAVSAVMAPRAEGAVDLKTEYLAPANLPNGEAPAGQNMTLKVRVTNTSTTESSASVRLSINKYDHTCSGYPKNQPKLAADPSKTYKELSLGPGATLDVEFIDDSTAVPANTASVSNCYKTALQSSSGGYYSDSNSLNHSQEKVVKYVPGTGTTTPAPLAFTVSNLRTSPTSCGPGQHWVEATVNSTQIVRGASVSVEGISTTAIQKNVDLQSGNNVVRVMGTYSQAGDYAVKLTASAVSNGATVSGNQQINATIPKCKGTLSITAPAGGETVAASTSYTVRWSSSNVPSDDRITIRVYDGAAWHEVATETPNDGSELLTMPAGSATNAKVQMFSQKVSASAYSRDFTLGGGGPTTVSGITVTQPAGGEAASPGQTVFVRWTNSGTPGNQVKVRLFRDGAYFGELTQLITNDGNESVLLPTNIQPTTDAKIEVISSTNVRGLSNAFSIGGGGDPAASISVTAPAANAQLNAGATTTVTWTSTGTTGSTVKLRLSLNNGAFADLETNVNNDGSEEVTLPAIFNHSAGTGLIVGPSAAKIEVASTSTTAKGESGRFQIKVPALSFNSHLYNKIKGDCSACHPIATKSDGTAVRYQDSQNNDMINPQKARAQDDLASTVNETVSPVIPFSSAITAAEMLRRFKTVKAVSTDYSGAGMLYVVPSNPNNSGLHRKAQESTSPIFEENLTIEGFVLKVQDWITLWIKQGAAD